MTCSEFTNKNETKYVLPQPYNLLGYFVHWLQIQTLWRWPWIYIKL